jgi:hypothetical protein
MEMRCVEQTPSKRVYLRGLGVLSVSAIFALFLVLCLCSLTWRFLVDRSFTCYRLDQDMVNCKVVFQPLLLPKWVRSYYNVRGAKTKTEVQIDFEGDKRTYYYVTLITSAGEKEAWSTASESEARQLATKIQSFRVSAESQLLVARNSPFPEEVYFVIFVSGMLILTPIIVLIIDQLRNRRLTFDRSLDRILEEYLTPFGVRKRKTYSFRDVKQVVVESTTDSDGDTFFSIKVQLQSGEPLLYLSFGTDGSKARAEAEQLGQLLRCPVRLPETTP